MIFYAFNEYKRLKAVKYTGGSRNVLGGPHHVAD